MPRAYGRVRVDIPNGQPVSMPDLALSVLPAWVLFLFTAFATVYAWGSWCIDRL